jgi:ubiquinone/menaquinone biosynthesis C-methylase UbiE
MSADKITFHSFEQAGWSERGVVDAYELALTQVTTQSIPALLDAAGVTRGMRVLDVATGPGHVAAAAAERGAVVTAIDFSPAMVERARSRGVDAREGDAQALPYSDGIFDAVVTSFGMLHFAEPERALAEAWRVLASGARMAFTVWAPADRAVVLGIPQQAVQRYGEVNTAMLPSGPSFFRFSDPDECLRTMQAARFETCRVIEVAQTWRLGSVDELWRALAEGTVRTRALLRAQTKDALTKIRDAIRTGMAPYEKVRGAFEIPMPATLASGVRP